MKRFFDYYSVTSDRLLVDTIAADAITQALPAGSVSPVMTYLANALERVDASGNVTHMVPYSMITAINSASGLPLDFTLPKNTTEAGGTDLVPLVINTWAAGKLDAEIGTRIRVAYYEPEVENGNEIEQSFDAIITDIVPITKPDKPYRRRREAVFDQPPTVYNDPDLTPNVPGVTDQDSINDWDVPFEMTRATNADDDLYLNNYRLTPKAFLPLETGRELFGSRFGNTTNLRIDPTAVESREQLESLILQATRPSLPELGWQVRSLRDAQLAASSGTTPFDGLFLALSMFVILAAVMLIAMLFRLGLMGRQKQIDTLMAIGWPRGKVFRMILGEGAVIALAGTLVGIAGGIGYAVLVLAALRTFWVGAVTVPFLTFHASPLSLVIGSMSGMILGLATIAWSLRTMLGNQTISLLRGRDASEQVSSENTKSVLGNPWPRRLTVGLFITAVGTAGFGAISGGQTAAGAFVGGGMLTLVAALLWIYQRLRWGSIGAAKQANSADVDLAQSGFSMSRLAISNSTRSPLRSTLTIGLMAVASFLIVAITAFRLQPTDEGTGGFDLIADVAQPIYEDLADADVRAGLLGPDASVLDDCSLVMMRVRSGQDASCNNLYQATEPTVLGIPDRSVDQLSQFRFYAGQIVGGTDEETITPWHQLSRVATGSDEDPIPIIVDQNTAMWSLKMIKGIGERKQFQYDNRLLTFEVVGLLENSLLQGRLMVGEANFKTVFPDISGYSLVLIDTPDGMTDSVAAALETRLGDIGFDAANAGVV
ncbi:MAG: FtsX-like permease family protein, partial [Planctomycetota bacterium]